jgi:phosphatidylglycerol:prolipoprotein diacylglycerol transferase
LRIFWAALDFSAVHNTLFSIGPFTLHWYGVLMALGFFAGLWTASRRAERAGISPETIMDISAPLLIGGILGARILYVVSYWNESFAKAPWWEVLMIQHGGLVYYGGFIGAALAYFAFVFWKGIPVWKMADALAPSVPLGQAFGRFGCLMNGCCYGAPTDLPWAIHFPADHATGGVGVHPTQIYEAVLCVGLYVFLAWLFRHKRFDGVVLAAYLVGYAILRSFVEMFRGDYPARHLEGWVTPAHLVSAGILAAGLVLFAVLPRSRAAKA